MRFRMTLRAAAGLQGASGPTNLKVLTGMAAFLFIFASVLPAEVYSYTGVDFSSTFGTTYNSFDSVNATFTLNDPLGPDDSAYSAPFTSWTITDGYNTLCDTCGGSSLVSLIFTTDSSGNISDWYFEATNTGVDVLSGGSLAEGIGTSNTDEASTGGDSGTSTAGSWQDTTPTPEPGTFGMLLAGSLLLFGTMRRRANKPIV